MKSSSRNVDLVRKGYKAFNTGDMATVLDLLDENVEWTEMEGFPYAGTHRGPKAVRRNVFEKIGEEWENWQATPKDFIAAGERVVVLGEYTGTYEETGKRIQVPFAHVFTIKDEKVVEYRQYTDTELVQEAVQGARKKKVA